MITLKVAMKRGGTLLLEADGQCFHDTDGAGQSYREIEDLKLFWPEKARDKKRYEVRPDLIADWSKVQNDFWDACTSL